MSYNYSCRQKTSASYLNDYRPVALTSVVIKTSEKLVLKSVNLLIPANTDLYQFAYRSSQDVDDTILTTVQQMLMHLESEGSYDHMMLLECTSAFNTIVHTQLYSN